MLSDPLSGSTSTVPVTVLPMDFESSRRARKRRAIRARVYWKKGAQTQKRRAAATAVREGGRENCLSGMVEWRSQREERSFGEKTHRPRNTGR